MSTDAQIKINQLLQKQSPGALFFGTWMYANGISYELQRRYRESSWLISIGTGVMVRVGSTPTIYAALSCFNAQMNKHLSIGAMSALEMAGYSHYIPMGKSSVVVFVPKKEWFPKWLEQYDWGTNLIKVSSEYFSHESGLVTYKQGEFDVLISSPERAFLECLYLVPKYYNLMDLYYVMEQLTTLRPPVLQTLLEDCKSVKVKRLFMYMAEKANHLWLHDLDLSRISLGSGKREVVKKGVFNKKYQITIPMELDSYE